MGPEKEKHKVQNEILYICMEFYLLKKQKQKTLLLATPITGWSLPLGSDDVAKDTGPAGDTVGLEATSLTPEGSNAWPTSPYCFSFT